MIADLITPNTKAGMFRRDWGLENMIGADTRPLHGVAPDMLNSFRQQKVRGKIANFLQRAVYPQQLTIPRQYATTQAGVSIYKIMHGRVIDGLQEDGVRIVVLENAQQARFVISPLFGNEFDARAWARQNMGAEA